MAISGSMISKEDWTSYSERLAEYFTANNVEEAAKKQAILLSMVGVSTYQLIRNLVAPCMKANTEGIQ